MSKAENRVANLSVHAEFIAKGYRHTYHPADPDEGRPACDEYENDVEAVLVEEDGTTTHIPAGKPQ